MAVELRMPKLGMTMTKGKIVRWIKSEGDTIEADEPVYAVANDKVTIDVESPEAGVLLKMVAEEGDMVPVGDIVAYIGQAGESIPDEVSPISEAQDSEPVSKPATKIAKISESASASELRATPAARACAKKLGIDLMEVKNRYGKSRIKRADVERYDAEAETETLSAGSSSEPAYVDIVPSDIRMIAADRMTENFMNVPHFYLGMKVDVTKMQEMLEHARRRAEEGQYKPTFTDILVWIISRVIREQPIINSQWNDGKVRQFRDVNFGIATDTSDGLVVPVIHQADSKVFGDIVRERSRVITAAREGKLKPEDLMGGTFTLSNLGMFGIDVFQAIINSPECALLTVGAVESELSLEGDSVKSIPIMKMSLTCDHRVLDGATGARFLKRMKEVMEEPAKLLDRDLF